MSVAIIGFGKTATLLPRRLPARVLKCPLQPRATRQALLAENLGFAPIKLGGLSEGGLLVQARGITIDSRNGEVFMSTRENVQIVKDFFAAIGRGDKQGVLALVAEDIEWIIPGEDWPLAGTHRGHAGLAEVLRKASVEVETTYPEPPEFVAQGDRVLVVGVATGKIKATNRAFRDDWVFAITVQNGKVTKIREYVDTQALARASHPAPSSNAQP
jgi:ketosteroid isomerase-like protein